MNEIRPGDKLEGEIALVCEALVREIGTATRWCAVVDAWQALLHVRLIGKGMLSELRRHHDPIQHSATQRSADG
jgi:hypothetical protein